VHRCIMHDTTHRNERCERRDNVKMISYHISLDEVRQVEYLLLGGALCSVAGFATRYVESGYWLVFGFVEFCRLFGSYLVIYNYLIFGYN